MGKGNKCGCQPKCWLLAFSCVPPMCFSSTAQRPAGLCHGTYKYPSCIRPCINFYFKHLINYLSDFNETSRKWSWHGLFHKIFKKNYSYHNCGCHGKKKTQPKILKIFKYVLFGICKA